MSGSPTDSGQCLLQILDDSTVQLGAVFAGSCPEHPAWEGPFSTGVGPSFEQQGKASNAPSSSPKEPAFNFQKLLGLVTFAEQPPKQLVVTCTDHDGTTFNRLIEVYPSEGPQAVPLGSFDLPWKSLFDKISNATGDKGDPKARAEGSLQAEAGWQARGQDHLCECPVKLTGSMTLLSAVGEWKYDLLNLLPKPWALAVKGANGLSSFLFGRKLITGEAAIKILGKITLDAHVAVVFPQKEVRGMLGATGLIKVDLTATLAGFEKVNKGDAGSAVGAICFKGTSEVKLEASLESGYPVRARCKFGWNGLTVNITASWNLDTWFSDDSYSAKAAAGKVVASGAATAASGSNILWEKKLLDGDTFFDIPIQVFPPAKPPAASSSAGRSPATQTSPWTHANLMYAMGGVR